MSEQCLKGNRGHTFRLKVIHSHSVSRSKARKLNSPAAMTTEAPGALTTPTNGPETVAEGPYYWEDLSIPLSFFYVT